MPIDESRSSSVSAWGSLPVLWGLLGVLAGVIASPPARPATMGWPVLVVFVIPLLLAAAGWCAGRAAVRHGVQLGVGAMVPAVVLASVVAGAGIAFWNWAVPETQEVVKGYDDGCLERTSFNMDRSPLIALGPRDGDLDIQGGSGDHLRFYVEPVLFPEALPADQRTRDRLRGIGCRVG